MKEGMIRHEKWRKFGKATTCHGSKSVRLAPVVILTELVSGFRYNCCLEYSVRQPIPELFQFQFSGTQLNKVSG